MSSSSNKKKRTPREKVITEPSELVPKSVCTRLQIALVMTGRISAAQAKRVMNGKSAPDEWFDEVGVMCAWDVYDEPHKARVRTTLKRYLGNACVMFLGVPAGAARVTQIRDALYASPLLTNVAVPRSAKAPECSDPNNRCRVRAWGPDPPTVPSVDPTDTKSDQ
jgi:hypothetical protein